MIFVQNVGGLDLYLGSMLLVFHLGFLVLKVDTPRTEAMELYNGWKFRGGMKGEKLWCRWKMFGRLVGQEMIGRNMQMICDTNWCEDAVWTKQSERWWRCPEIWKRHSFLGLKLVMQKILCVFFLNEGLIESQPNMSGSFRPDGSGLEFPTPRVSNQRGGLRKQIKIAC